MQLCAIVLAAGLGTRINAGIPKQFLFVDDRPLIIHTLEKISNNQAIKGIIVVCNETYMSHVKEITSFYNIRRIEGIVKGGSTGIESTYNGLLSVPDKYDSILIHDGNRPVIDDDIIDGAIDVYLKHGNAVSAIPSVELTYESSDGLSSIKYINRDTVWRTQTPQIYSKEELNVEFKLAVNEEKFKEYSSVTEMFCAHGKRIFFSKGKTSNIKVTYEEDFDVVSRLLSNPITE